MYLSACRRIYRLPQRTFSDKNPFLFDAKTNQGKKAKKEKGKEKKQITKHVLMEIVTIE